MRITASHSGVSSSSSSKHHHSADSHKRHKSNSASSVGGGGSNSKNHHGESDSGKKCFKVRNSAESMLDLSLFPTPPSPSVRFAGVVGGNHRIEQLEKHVASLTTALHHALSAGVGNGGGGALMNAILPLTPNSAPPVLNGGSAPSRGRPRKNGMPAQSRSSLNHGNYNNNNNNNNSSRKVNNTNKKSSQKRKVRHLSSSSEEEYDAADGGNSSQPPFNPEDIEDLKILKNDLENLRGKPLGSFICCHLVMI